MILTAGFKPSIKAKILGANLTVLTDIKDLALKTKTLEGKKKAKPNGNSFQINLTKKVEDIDSFRFGNNGGGFKSGPPQQRYGGRKDINEEVDMTLQPEEDTINLKMDKHSHKRGDSMDKEVPQHQPLIQTMNKWTSLALTAGKPLITQPNVGAKRKM
jgi:hypothetical protein